MAYKPPKQSSFSEILPNLAQSDVLVTIDVFGGARPLTRGKIYRTAKKLYVCLHPDQNKQIKPPVKFRLKDVKTFWCNPGNGNIFDSNSKPQWFITLKKGFKA